MLLMLLGALPAAAQTSASVPPPAMFDLIGYSQNGRYLAYEVYGYRGEDALPFSEVHLLDTVERRWVIGSPIIVEASKAGTSIDETRREARDRAAGLIADFQVARPAFLAAFNGDGSIGSEPNQLRFGIPGPGGSAPAVEFTLDLSTFATIAAGPCAGLMDELPKGFRLDISSFGQTSSIYEDGSLPRSRGCPSSYRILAVVLPYRAVDMTSAVAIVVADNHSDAWSYRSFVPVPLGAPGRGVN